MMNLNENVNFSSRDRYDCILLFIDCFTDVFFENVQIPRSQKSKERIGFLQ